MNDERIENGEKEQIQNDIDEKFWLKLKIYKNEIVFIFSFIILFLFEYIIFKIQIYLQDIDNHVIFLLTYRTIHLQRVIFPLSVVCSIIFIFALLGIMSEEKFLEKYNPDGNLQKEDYIKLKKWVIITTHHREINKFHEITIRNQNFCNGCLGTLLGLLGGELILTIYVMSPSDVVIYNEIMIFLGNLFFIFSLIKYLLNFTGFLRLLSNISFPIGLWLYLIGLTNLALSWVFICIIPIILIVIKLILTKWSHLTESENDLNSDNILDENDI